MSHDAINRYLREDRLTSRLIWENVRSQIEPSPYDYIVFDDTVLDKNGSHTIELVRRHYSGNAHGLIQGIGLVNCVYIHPEAGQYRVIDYRIYDPDHDGKLIKIKGFPKDYTVKLFRVLLVSTHRTDWVVTNDLSHDSLDATQEVCGMRWKIEQFHREIKQLTGIEKDQCRKARIQRNHIACAMLVWIRLTDLARKTRQTIYRIRHGLLDDYLCQQLKNPSVKMRFV